MNLLIENGILTEMSCGANFAYTLTDSSAFLSTEYKVLQSQADGCFVKCMRMLYNGKVQLYYYVNNYKSFSTMIAGLDAEHFMVLVSNLLNDVINVKNNGFLSCQNIDVSFDKIFVDPTTFKVSLVYLPLSRHIYGDYGSFENELRTGLVKLINSISTISSPKTMRLAVDLTDGKLTLDDLYSRIKSGKTIPAKLPVKPYEELNSQTNMRIIAMNAPMRVEIDVNKDEFILGKNPAAVDGVVSFNKMISRVHCKINKVGDKFTITDLKSANGTFVNNVRLAVSQSYPLKNGDVVRLANSSFQIRIG